MTGTELIEAEKASIFNVRIDITDCKDKRNIMVKKLREICWNFAVQLADIIEKG